MTPQRASACNPCRAGGVGNIPGYNLGLQAIAASEGVGLVDVFAIHLSAFATRALVADFGRSADDVADASAQALLSVLEASEP